MRQSTSRLAGVLLIGTAAACTGQGAAETASDTRTQAQAHAELVDASGERVGTATFTQTPRGVEIDVEVSGLPQGEHGLHVHETGQCEAPDFQSAGGHFNPAGRQHGMEVHGGPHAGDLPNLIVGADGTGSNTILSPYLTLDEGAGSLLQPGGTALMVHAGSDDYESQPSGDAGDRIACGVIGQS